MSHDCQGKFSIIHLPMVSQKFWNSTLNPTHSTQLKCIERDMLSIGTRTEEWIQWNYAILPMQAFSPKRSAFTKTSKLHASLWLTTTATSKNHLIKLTDFFSSIHPCLHIHTLSLSTSSSCRSFSSSSLNWQSPVLQKATNFPVLPSNTAFQCQQQRLEPLPISSRSIPN